MNRKVSKEQYETIKVLIETGNIKTFNQIFTVTGIKRTNFADDIGMNYQTFMYRLKHPGSFSYKESFIIAYLIGISKEAVSRLIIAQSEDNSIQNPLQDKE